MSRINFISFLLLLGLSSCNSNNNKEEISASDSLTINEAKPDSIVVQNWQAGFNLSHNPDKDSINGKAVSFYINNKNCSPLAIEFYWGRFRPSDNDSTTKLLSLVTTKDVTLRPFYRWCLDKTILIQDGALGEYTGVPARKYIELYPKEFLEYCNYDTVKITDWTDAIYYSGYYADEDYHNHLNIEKKFLATMKENCDNCNKRDFDLLVKIAKNSFHQTEKE